MRLFKQQEPMRSAMVAVVAVFAALSMGGWTHPGGDPGHQKYAALDQITQLNVTRLTQAWLFSTGDLAARLEIVAGWKFQVTPIMIEGRLIFCRPRNEVIALDPGTGAQIWRFDPQVSDTVFEPNARVCRGVTPWIDAEAPADAPCARAFSPQRLIAGSAPSMHIPGRAAPASALMSKFASSLNGL